MTASLSLSWLIALMHLQLSYNYGMLRIKSLTLGWFIIIITFDTPYLSFSKLKRSYGEICTNFDI